MAGNVEQAESSHKKPHLGRQKLILHKYAIHISLGILSSAMTNIGHGCRQVAVVCRHCLLDSRQLYV